MRKTGLVLLFLLLAKPVYSDSLDSHYDELKIHGGLAGLCRVKPDIAECRIAIGEWKPSELSRVKAISPFCVDTCKHDVFGFVQSSLGDREYPVVSTKDFSPTSASKGVEISLLPVALKAYEYNACNGCNHIQTFPVGLTALLNGKSVVLPVIGRGIFYIPSEFRRYVLAQANKMITLTLQMPNDQSVNARISSKALIEYTKMLRTLDYDKVP